MRTIVFVLVAASVLTARPSPADEHRIMRRPLDKAPSPEVVVPVQTIRGTLIGCGAITKPNTKALTGLGGVHTAFCVEATSGEVIVMFLRKNGTLVCSSHGFVDPNNVNCATVSGCASGYYCLL